MLLAFTTKLSYFRSAIPITEDATNRISRMVPFRIAAHWRGGERADRGISVRMGGVPSELLIDLLPKRRILLHSSSRNPRISFNFTGPVAQVDTRPNDRSELCHRSVGRGATAPDLSCERSEQMTNRGSRTTGLFENGQRACCASYCHFQNPAVVWRD